MVYDQQHPPLHPSHPSHDSSSPPHDSSTLSSSPLSSSSTHPPKKSRRDSTGAAIYRSSRPAADQHLSSASAETPPPPPETTSRGQPPETTSRGQQTTIGSPLKRPREDSSLDMLIDGGAAGGQGAAAAGEDGSTCPGGDPGIALINGSFLPGGKKDDSVFVLEGGGGVRGAPQHVGRDQHQHSAPGGATPTTQDASNSKSSKTSIRWGTGEYEDLLVERSLSRCSVSSGSPSSGDQSDVHSSAHAAPREPRRGMGGAVDDVFGGGAAVAHDAVVSGGAATHDVVVSGGGAPAYDVAVSGGGAPAYDVAVSGGGAPAYDVAVSGGAAASTGKTEGRLRRRRVGPTGRLPSECDLVGGPWSWKTRSSATAGFISTSTRHEEIQKSSFSEEFFRKNPKQREKSPPTADDKDEPAATLSHAPTAVGLGVQKTAWPTVEAWLAGLDELLDVPPPQEPPPYTQDAPGAPTPVQLNEDASGPPTPNEDASGPPTTTPHFSPHCAGELASSNLNGCAPSTLSSYERGNHSPADHSHVRLYKRKVTSHNVGSWFHDVRRDVSWWRPVETSRGDVPWRGGVVDVHTIRV